MDQQVKGSSERKYAHRTKQLYISVVIHFFKTASFFPNFLYSCRKFSHRFLVQFPFCSKSSPENSAVCVSLSARYISAILHCFCRIFFDHLTLPPHFLHFSSTASCSWRNRCLSLAHDSSCCIGKFRTILVIHNCFLL